MRVDDELNGIGRRSVKLVGCGLLDTKKMRIGAAGLYESLKGLGAGKLKAKVLHRSGTLPRRAANVIGIEVGKEVELVICCLLIAEDESKVMLARLLGWLGNVCLLVVGWKVAGVEADHKGWPLARKLME